jgi:hypothetical protein
MAAPGSSTQQNPWGMGIPAMGGDGKSGEFPSLTHSCPQLLPGAWTQSMWVHPSLAYLLQLWNPVEYQG